MLLALAIAALAATPATYAYRPAEPAEPGVFVSAACEAWIRWTVDGKVAPERPGQYFCFPEWTLWRMSMACLGRPPLTRPPHKGPPVTIKEWAI